MLLLEEQMCPSGNPSATHFQSGPSSYFTLLYVILKSILCDELNRKKINKKQSIYIIKKKVIGNSGPKRKMWKTGRTKNGGMEPCPLLWLSRKIEGWECISKRWL
ncbi:hypothetical protein AMECASPLE_014019 [Ameca splendens]|uniref:Uncharacterized protein n=1 Tax=Ameca splendens TaxID=208324 RepID=A0ABV0YZT1_9TELE